jgi:hypothetical protein
MSYLLGLTLLVLSGVALLRLVRLATGCWLVDAPLGWFVGCGWFGLASMLLRFLLGIPHGRAVALLVLAIPIAAWGALRYRAPRLLGPAPDPLAPLRFPRPRWLFGPVAAYVLVVVLAVILHGANTPTHTDDGVRVRAFTPMLAFADGWNPTARALFMMAGPVTTFVPSLGWSLSGTLDHFHVNYFVGTSLVAFLLLAIGLATSRGAPERGWAQALAALSLPLLVYHCTSTYSDAVLALFLAAGALFVMEYGRTRELADALRAGLLLAVAATVKREGEVVAGSVLFLFVLQVAWNARATGRRPLLRLAAFAGIPLALFAAGKIACVGLAEAFPIVNVLSSAAPGGAPGMSPGMSAGYLRAAAAPAFVHALFRSWNPGMVFWLLPLPLLLRPRLLRSQPFAWSFAAVLLLLAETAYISVWSMPQFTLNETTVHRALLIPSLLAACWIAAAAAEPTEERS